MSVRERNKGIWEYDFWLKGERYKRNCVDANGVPVTNKRAALACEAEARRVAAIAPKLPSVSELSLAQAVDAIRGSWVNTKEEESKNRFARELLAYFKPETLCREIDEARIQDYTTHLKSSPVLIWTGGPNRKRDDPNAAKCWKPVASGRLKSPATCNQYLILLRLALKRAYNTRDPITGKRAIEDLPAVVELKKHKRKARPVPQPVLTEVLTTLPQHAAEALELTLYFGFRQAEAFTLTVSQIDREGGGIRLRANQVKDGEDAFLPGNAEAMAFVEKLARQAAARGMRHLITYRQTDAQKWRPIRSPRRCWNTVMRGIEKKFGARWRWHDIRAAYITRVAMLAGPVAAQKLARHSVFSTTQAYIDVADDVMRQGAEAAGSWATLRVVGGTSR